MSSALRILRMLTATALIACGNSAPAAAPTPVEPAPAPPPSATQAEPQPSAAATPTPAPEPAPKDALPAQQPRSAEQPAQARAPKPSSKPAAESAAPPKPSEPAASPAAPAPAPATPAAASAAVACGEKNQPRCPLQGWMENHLQSALDASDLAGVEKGLTQLTQLAPEPSWNAGTTGWSELAKTGAAAAANGDMNSVKQTCKSCHKAWRTKYKQAAFRSRPIP